MAEKVNNLYGIKPDYNIELYSVDLNNFEKAKKRAFENGCLFVLTEYGQKSKNGTWTNYSNFEYYIFEKDCGADKGFIPIGNWRASIKRGSWLNSSITMIIYDKNYVSREYEAFGSRIDGVKDGIDHLKNLNSYQDWGHWDLFVEAKRLRSKVENQDKQIQNLQLELEDFKSKTVNKNATN